MNHRYKTTLRNSQTILQALKGGTVAIVDEFDVNLHPEMAIAV